MQQHLFTEDEWFERYKMTPAERWNETRRLWLFYLAAGGSLDAEPDSQSPFDNRFAQRSLPSDGRTGGLRFLFRTRPLVTLLRPLLADARQGTLPSLEQALFEAEKAERDIDRRYWLPLRKELEELRSLNFPTEEEV